MSSPTDIHVGALGLTRPHEPIRHVEKCMGTMFSFHIAAPSVDPAALSSVLAWLHDMDALFSTYRPDSQISRIDAGQLDLADADPTVRAVLTACDEYRVRTDGYFSARPDRQRLDPSGLVKGWAIQRASDMLVDAGSTNHCVNGGGDVFCVGNPEPGRPWRIGIADPQHRDMLIRTVTASGPIGVATSGLAERGAHIYDPHTGNPATELASVTIAGPNLTWADVAATTVAAMGVTRGTAWLRSQPDLLAFLITADGDTISPVPRVEARSSLVA